MAWSLTFFMEQEGYCKFDSLVVKKETHIFQGNVSVATLVDMNG